jgi:hypothetical protein
MKSAFRIIGNLLSPLTRNDTALGDLLHAAREYYWHFERVPNLFRPARFTEHMVILRARNETRSLLRRFMTDKYLAKCFIADKIGSGYTAKTIALLTTMEEALTYAYPDECAIKPTHLSGPIIIRRGEATRPVAKDQIRSWFTKTYYQYHREPNYRGLKPKVIVEELLADSSGQVPSDYKVYCFHGKPAIVQVDRNRFQTRNQDFYTCDWEHLDFTKGKPRPVDLTARPRELPEILGFASTLSSGCSFLRVDFYITTKGLKVGELTSFPQGGLTDFDPDIWDRILGSQFANPGRPISATLRNTPI